MRPERSSRSTAVRVLDGPGVLSWAPRVWPCYDTVFGDAADHSSWRTELFERHAQRDHYRLAVALDDREVVGFAWGHVGERGQYWSDVQVMGRDPGPAPC